MSWAEPGVDEVSKGVYRIPLPVPQDSLGAVNVYAIDDGNGLFFIDSGWDLMESREALETALGSLGYTFADIRRFLITHMHSDHYGLALRIRRSFGTPISLGAAEQQSIDICSSPNYEHFDETIRLLIDAGAEELIADLRAVHRDDDLQKAYVWEQPDSWIEPGEILIGARRLHAIHTPGHTHGHMVFHDAEAGLLFAGDHILPQITPSVGLEPIAAPFPLVDFMESLHRVVRLPDARLLPAHGPVVESAHARCEELLTYHERRVLEILDVLDDGDYTAYDIARLMKWTRRQLPLGELELFSRTMAINQIKAHLDVCVARGLLDADRGHTGEFHYTRVVT